MCGPIGELIDAALNAVPPKPTPTAPDTHAPMELKARVIGIPYNHVPMEQVLH
jgi:hypothetical protein